MHDLGPNQLEHVQMNYEHAYEVPMSGEFSGESPLQEIFAQEASYQEAPYQETAYHEAPYQEAEYHEAQSYESPLGEFQGETYHETPYGHEVYESPVGQEYQESPLGHEYQETELNEFSQEDELGMAAELLEVQNEEELDRFLGKLVRRVARGAGRFLRSPAGNMLKNVLRQVAKRALPIAGKALGTFIGGPIGGMAAGYVTNMAGQALGLETQGMSEDEANFASARQFVRFATNAARRAAQTVGDPRNLNPNAIAQTAVRAAAQQFAPGLLGPQYGRLPVAPMRAGRRGVWVRRGNTIKLYGV